MKIPDNAESFTGQHSLEIGRKTGRREGLLGSALNPKSFF
jgi:hypothetical protein